jgi:hypothetical protein
MFHPRLIRNPDGAHARIPPVWRIALRHASKRRMHVQAADFAQTASVDLPNVQLSVMQP